MVESGVQGLEIDGEDGEGVGSGDLEVVIRIERIRPRDGFISIAQCVPIRIVVGGVGAMGVEFVGISQPVAIGVGGGTDEFIASDVDDSGSVGIAIKRNWNAVEIVTNLKKTVATSVNTFRGLQQVIIAATDESGRKGGIIRRSGRFSTSSVGANIVFFISPRDQPSWDGVRRRLKDYALQKGYAISFWNPEEYQSVKQANRELEAQGIRGIVATQLTRHRSAEFISQLDITHRAMVGGEMNRKLFHSVAFNWAEMMSQVITFLAKKGYRKISILLYENDPIRFYDKQRLGAIAAEQKSFPGQINLHAIPIQWTADAPELPYPYAEVTSRMKQLLKEDQPDAVIGWSDGACWILKDLGFSMPDDIGYAALVSNGDACGMQVSHFELWKLELDRLIELIRTGEFGRPDSPVISLYTPKFVDRGSA